MNKKMLLMLLAAAVMFFAAGGPVGHAEEGVGGVAGCASVAVDPAASLEFQQGVCNAAEDTPATSCGSGGHGVCSSPKLNDTMPDGNHCICISESEEAVTE